MISLTLSSSKTWAAPTLKDFASLTHAEKLDIAGCYDSLFVCHHDLQESQKEPQVNWTRLMLMFLGGVIVGGLGSDLLRR